MVILSLIKWNVFYRANFFEKGNLILKNNDSKTQKNSLLLIVLMIKIDRSGHKKFQFQNYSKNMQKRSFYK